MFIMSILSNTMADDKLKKRIARCLDLLTTVMSRRGLNRKLLAEKHGCSVRAIADDLKVLNDVGFDIHYDHARREYALGSHRVTIPPLPMTEEHLLSLFIASQLMALTPLEDTANNAVEKICVSEGDDVRAFLRNLSDRVCIAPGGEIGDARIWADAYRAVSECQSIAIEYQAFSTKQLEHWTLDPCGLYLKELDRSYLLGLTYSQPRKFHPFKLCRIKKLRFRHIRFSYPANFSLRRYIANGFWSSDDDGDASIDIEVRFHPSVAQLVREREPQERLTEMPDGSLRLRRTVRNVDEMYYELLRYGHWAEVLRPQALRDKLKAEAEKMVKMYA